MTMVFTPWAGGLGDILENYLDGDVGHFPCLKRLGYTTAVKMWCTNPDAGQLLRFNPHIEHVLAHPFAPAQGMTTGFRAWAQSQEPKFRLLTETERAVVPWERPAFHLAPDEAEFAAVIGDGPFVAVHPFAGRPERNFGEPNGLAKAIVHIAAKAAPLVLILGGDSTRNGARLVERSLNYPASNVIDLVNRFSIRLHAHLASRAKWFIGSVSCFNVVAQCCGVPALVFAGPVNRPDMRDGGSVFAKMRVNGTRVHFLDLPFNGNIVREFLQ